jgi:integrase
MKIRYEKNDKRYWTRKVTFHTASCRSYSVSIQHARARRRIGLRTSDREQAGASALQFYQRLKVHGWDDTLRWWKGDLHDAPKSDVTIGEYIDAVIERSIFRPKTLTSYVAAFRQIVGEIAEEPNRERRNRIKLRAITPEKVEAWRVEFIRKRSSNPLKEKSARVSVSSLLLRAKQLFSSDMIARVKDVVELPVVLPFAGIKVESAPMPRYRATFDMIELLEAAQRELAGDRPEEFKILLLAAMAGLRRNEIDSLQWTAFRWNENLIRVEATEFYRPKSSNSEGDVIVDAELMEVFRGYYARRKSGFVIESEFEPVANDEPYGTYRCRQHMGALLIWLRSKGVISRSPLHALRKEFGSQIFAQHGLLAASEQLRHANIQTSARHYIENRRRSTPGLGHLLKSERTIVPMREVTSA